MCHNKKILWACGCTKAAGLIHVCRYYFRAGGKLPWEEGICPRENWKLLETDDGSERKRCIKHL
jgi:hypothetical protein